MPIELCDPESLRARTRGTPEVLIVKPSSLGDVVHALPVLEPLREALPTARLTWLVFAEHATVVRRHPALDRVWVIPHPRLKLLRARGAIAGALGFFAALRRERFDAVLDLQGLARSAVITQATEAAVRVGFRDAREGAIATYTHLVDDPGKHLVHRYLAAASAVVPPLRGWGSNAEAALEAGRFGLAPEADAVARVAALLTEHGVARDQPIVTLAACDRRRGTKSLPPERTADLATLLARAIPGGVVALIGAPSEAEVVATVHARVDESVRPRVLNLAAKTDLAGLIALIARAACHVGGDSGPMHLAYALERPCVAVFGPTPPERYGPFGVPHAIVTGDCEERIMPCWRQACSHHSCMQTVSLEAITAAVQRLRTTPPLHPPPTTGKHPIAPNTATG